MLLILTILILYQSNHVEIYRNMKLRNINNVSDYDDKYLRKNRINSKRKVVISLTTIPDRIDKLKPTLCSLLDNTKRVDEIVINIPYKTIKGDRYKIPKWLKSLKNVKIYRVDKDYGPSTKLLPTLLRESSKTIIIVVDDDVIYGSKTIESYIDEFYNRNCKDALTIFGAFVTKKLQIENEKSPTWLRFRKCQYVDLLMGHNSFLVTKEMFKDLSKVFDYESAPNECKWVDDIWFSGWLNYFGIKIFSIANKKGCIPITNFANIDCSTSLCFTQNDTSHNNDKCIKWFYKNKKVKFLIHK